MLSLNMSFPFIQCELPEGRKLLCIHSQWPLLHRVEIDHTAVQKSARGSANCGHLWLVGLQVAHFTGMFSVCC